MHAPKRASRVRSALGAARRRRGRPGRAGLRRRVCAEGAHCEDWLLSLLESVLLEGAVGSYAAEAAGDGFAAELAFA